MNSFDKFDEEQLPEKKFFYSHLYEENITDKDDSRANIIWKHFNIKNLSEYHDFYLMTDVYLLTDVLCFWKLQGIVSELLWFRPSLLCYIT